MHQIDFENGSITSNLFQTALPMLVAQILTLLYSIIDRVYIGRTALPVALRYRSAAPVAHALDRDPFVRGRWIAVVDPEERADPHIRFGTDAGLDAVRRKIHDLAGPEVPYMFIAEIEK